MKRISSIDAVRGLVMLVMALDHVRDLVHFSGVSHDPTDLTTTTPFIFGTRWITHLCAPTFVFLSGVSAYLAYSNSKDQKSSKQFLVTRGVWLIMLEFTLINFAIWFDIHFRITMMQVIAAIGTSFILLMFFVNRPSRQNFAIAIMITLVCNLVAGFDFPSFPALNFVYHWLFSPKVFQVTSNYMLFVGYPVLPWFGIMLAGYASGVLFLKSKEERMRIFIRISAILISLFIVVRATNLWGDPSKWSIQKDGVFTFLSFMNISKYPPSLMYIFITIGIAFLLLFISEKYEGKWKEVITVYGSVPMFYYLLHFYIIHIIGQLVFIFQGFAWSDFQFAPFRFGRPEGSSGVGLMYVYLIWLCIVALLYPLCKGYATYKKAHPENAWLKYL